LEKAGKNNAALKVRLADPYGDIIESVE
jgi:hypothetical protein